MTPHSISTWIDLYFNMDRPVYAFGTPEGSSAALSAATNLGWQPDSEMTQHI